MALLYDENKRYLFADSNGGSLFNLELYTRERLNKENGKRITIDKNTYKLSDVKKNQELYLGEKLHGCYNGGKEYVIHEASVLMNENDRWNDASWAYGFIYTIYKGKSCIALLSLVNGVKKFKLKINKKGKLILPDYAPDRINQSYIDDHVYDIMKKEGYDGDKKKLSCRLASAMAMIIYKSNPSGMKNIKKQDVINFYNKAKNTRAVSGDDKLGLGDESKLATLYDSALTFNLGSEKKVDKQTIIEELEKGNPVFASFAYHTEVIYGYDAEEDVFLIDDVGYQGDVEIDPNDSWYGTTSIGLPTFEYQSVERRCLKTIRCII
jgi:hypothetical protein